MKQVQWGLDDISKVTALGGGNALVRLLLACPFIQTWFFPSVQKQWLLWGGQAGSSVQELKAPMLQPRLCTLITNLCPDFIISTMKGLISVI